MKIDDILKSDEPVDKAALRHYLAGRELATPEDYGALGDGVADDAPAINAALAATGGCWIGPRTYRVGSPVEVPAGASLLGTGFGSTLMAEDRSHPIVHVVAGDATVRGLRTVNGCTGLTLSPRDDHNWHCVIAGLSIEDATVGLFLDGLTEHNYRCYWNSFEDIAILRPRQHGLVLDKTGGAEGDTPNANKFFRIHVFSLGQPMPGGSGFYIKQGNFMNAFVDCEANVHTDAAACARVGGNAQTNVFVNLYTEAQAAVVNLQLDPGSTDTRIVNLFAAAAGPAIHDLSGGQYQAFGAGWPDTWRLARGRATDLTVERLRWDTAFVEGESAVALDGPSSCFLVSAFAGPVAASLPAPGDAPGRQILVKKTDPSAHPVTVDAADASGLDGHPVVLGRQHDWVCAVSNGAAWFVVSRARPAPVGPYAVAGTAFTRSLNADTASFEELRGFVRALASDLIGLGLLAE